MDLQYTQPWWIEYAPDLKLTFIIKNNYKSEILKSRY
jgi:hypothetical protein